MRQLAVGDIKIIQQSMMRSNARLHQSMRRPSELFIGLFVNGTSPDMNVNGSVTPVQFKLVAPVDLLVTKIQGVILDGGIEPDLFGGLPALTNGVNLEAYNADDSLIGDLSLGGVKANWQFSLFSIAFAQIYKGSTVDRMEIGIEFAQDMLLEAGQYLSIKVRDNLTGLQEFQVSLRAYFLDSVVPILTE